MTNPSTFLLDEPLSSLDAKLRRELRAECDRLHEELKRTFIFVTHDQEEAMTLADRIVVMREGEIEQIGSPMEIYSESGQLFRRRFLRLAVDEPDRRRGRARGGRARASARRASTFALPERFKDVPRRPRDARHPAGARAACGRRTRATIELPVRLVEPLGKDTLLYFDDGTERAFIAVSEGLAMAEELRAGARVSLDFDPRRLYLFGADGRRIAAGES